MIHHIVPNVSQIIYLTMENVICVMRINVIIVQATKYVGSVRILSS